MRALLTSGIKAILAIAALSTAAHWALRIQREPGTSVRPVLASVAEPDQTGSIAPRRIDAAQASAPASAIQQAAVQPSEPVRTAPGLDQSGLSALMSGAAETPRPRPIAKASGPAKASVLPKASVPGRAAVQATAAKVAVSAKATAPIKPVASATPAVPVASAKGLANGKTLANGKGEAVKVASAKPASPKPAPTTKVAALEKADTGAKAPRH